MSHALEARPHRPHHGNYENIEADCAVQTGRQESGQYSRIRFGTLLPIVVNYGQPL